MLPAVSSAIIPVSPDIFKFDKYRSTVHRDHESKLANLATYTHTDFAGVWWMGIE